MAARLLAITGVIVTMLLLAPGTASATGCVQVRYGTAGAPTGRCGTVASAATWMTVGVVVGVVLGYLLVRGQRATREVPSPTEPSAPQPKPAQPPPKPPPPPPKPPPPPPKPPPPPPPPPPPKPKIRINPYDIDEVYKFWQTLEDAAVAMVETRPDRFGGPDVEALPVKDWGLFGALGLAVFGIAVARRLGGTMGRRLTQLNTRLVYQLHPGDHAPGEPAVRVAVGNLIAGVHSGQSIEDLTDAELVEIAALTSTVCGVLVSRRFASAGDVRIRPFIDTLPYLTGTAHGVPAQLAEATIRVTLGEPALLPTIPPDQLTATQVLVSHAILVEHSATPQQVRGVLDCAEPLAHLAARQLAVA